MAELSLDTYETIVPNALYGRVDLIPSEIPKTEVRFLRTYTHFTNHTLLSRLTAAAMAANGNGQEYYPKLNEYLRTLPQPILEALQRSNGDSPVSPVNFLPDLAFKPGSTYLSSTFTLVPSSRLRDLRAKFGSDEEQLLEEILTFLGSEQVTRRTVHVRLTNAGNYPTEESPNTLVTKNNLLVHGPIDSRELEAEIELMKRAAKFARYLYDESSRIFEQNAIAVASDFANELELRTI